MKHFNLDLWVLGYLATALWSSNDPEAGIEDNCEWSNEAKVRATEDCQKFMEKIREAFPAPEAEEIILKEGNTLHYLAAHDFWLTRVGHGAGFWDGDWPDEQGEKLTELSKSMGEHIYVYKGDDGLLYFG